MAVYALLATIVPSAVAQSNATGPHTAITMLADRDAIVPGERLHIGLRFQMEKGWHIYWVNPGDSGEPPKVQWQLPAGFQTGAIEWPTPKRLNAPSITDYGYEDEVLLVALVHVPANLKHGEKAALTVKVNWLVCREICIPGKAQLTLELPVGSGSASHTSEAPELFEQARGKLPQKAPAGWKFLATAEKDDFVLTAETGKAEPAATFFPLQAEQIKNDAPQVVTTFPQGVRLKLQKSDGLLKPISMLNGVLVLGSGRAYEIAAPVRTANR
ncbi:MAG: protein-disulfide reductase DsbD domain-containing protein [Candidatus Acidiferrales bacterium]